MVERISKYVHESMWVPWAKNLIVNEKLSEEREDRWKKLFIPYEELSEEEKDKDRKFAIEILQEIDRGYYHGDYHIGMQLSDLKIPGGGGTR
jgi:hypothetical protein